MCKPQSSFPEGRGQLTYVGKQIQQNSEKSPCRTPQHSLAAARDLDQVFHGNETVVTSIQNPIAKNTSSFSPLFERHEALLGKPKTPGAPAGDHTGRRGDRKLKRTLVCSGGDLTKALGKNEIRGDLLINWIMGYPQPLIKPSDHQEDRQDRESGHGRASPECFHVADGP